jgi:GNAT superfamily N-acetyltransferase
VTASRSVATIRPLGQPGDLGWVVMAHGEVYAKEFGWDVSFEALVARVVADYAQASPPFASSGAETGSPPGAAWIAHVDGRRVGCVFCVPRDDATAQLRILLVDPSVRGQGLGTALVAECVRFARDQGYRTLVLWTVDRLVSARKIYLAAGFALLSEETQRSFGADLVGQTYALDLMTPVPPAAMVSAPPH